MTSSSASTGRAKATMVRPSEAASSASERNGLPMPPAAAGREERGEAGIPADERRAGHRARPEAVAHGVEGRVQTGAGRLLDRQLELAGVLAVEARHRDAEQRQAARADRRPGLGEQLAHRGEHRGRRRGGAADGARAGRRRVVAEAQAQHDGAPGPPGAAHPARQPVDQLHQNGVELLWRPGAGAERRLGAEAAPSPSRPHRARVAVVRERVQVAPAGPADDLRQLVLAEPGELAHALDASCVQPSGRGRPDAPQPLHPQPVEQDHLVLGRNEHEAVGFGEGAGDLREALGRRDADGDRQAGLLAHLLPKALGDLQRRPDAAAHPAHVEERLVDREALHQGRGAAEDLEDRPAGLDVGGPARAHHHQIRAEAARPCPAHAAADAEGLGLVARGRDHAAADGHGAAPQRRIVTLLDRREEGVEIGVEDRRLAAHEHMFDDPPDGAQRSGGWERRDPGTLATVPRSRLRTTTGAPSRPLPRRTG